MSDSESELSLSMMRNITNKRKEIELQSRSKYSTVRINDPIGIIAKACSTHKFSTVNEDSALV